MSIGCSVFKRTKSKRVNRTFFERIHCDSANQKMRAACCLKDIRRGGVVAGEPRLARTGVFLHQMRIADHSNLVMSNT